MKNFFGGTVDHPIVGGLLRKAEKAAPASPPTLLEDNAFHELDDLIAFRETTASDSRLWTAPYEASDDDHEEMQGIMSFINTTEPEKTDPEPDTTFLQRCSQVKDKMRADARDVREGIKDLTIHAASLPVDELTKDRWVAGMYKPMLPEFPDLIQFWSEMNHRYGDLMMTKAARYNFSPKFYEEYDFVSLKARKYACINTDPPHELLSRDDVRWAPNAAVPTRATTFIIKEITKMGGRTHYYLEEFYSKRNKEMGQRMHSSIYPGAGQMDMAAMIKRTQVWKEQHNLP